MSDRGGGVKVSYAAKGLAATLVAYVVCDVLLTPPAGIETRNPADVTVLGIAALALLFIGLALSILALVLLGRGSGRSPLVAIVAAVLFLPAFLAEQTGHFSSLRPPTGIERIELVQVVVAVLVIGFAFLLLQRRAATTRNS
jgi:hypothetical protein